MRLDGRISRLIGCLLVFISLSTEVCHAQASSDSTDGGLASQVLESAKEHKNRAIYTKLDPEIISSTPDNKLAQVVQDYVRSKMNWTLSNELEILSKEPAVIKNVYIVSQIQAEVNQGGFSQLFSGTAARLTDSAVTAFEALKAPQTAAVLRKALEIRTAKGSEEELQAQDEEFFSLYDKENLNKLKVQYIRKNKKLFNTIQ